MGASSTTEKICTDDPSSNAETEIFECSQHPGRVLNQMFGLLESLLLCDVELIADDGGARVSGHRVVLAACSEYFRAMFTGSMRESKEKKIRLKDVKSEDLEKLVQFCYTGSIVIREDNVLSLLASANLLRFDTVVTACKEFLDHHTHSSNCIGIAFFAEQYNLKALQKNAEEYIYTNFTKVCKTEEFSKLSSDELRKILTHDDLQVDSEETIFNSLMSWIEYDKANREKYLKGFLSDLVRLRELKPTFIYKHVEPLCNTIETKIIVSEALKWHMFPEKRVNNEGYKPRKATNEGLLAMFRNNKEYSLQRYCTQTNKWTSVISDALPNVSEFGVALIDNKLFIVGGSVDKNSTNTLFSVDINTMQCVRLSNKSTCRKLMGVAELDGFLYTVGGYNHMSMKTLDIWDLKENTLSCASSMIQSREDPRVVALGGLLYAVGGKDNKWLHTVECYDPRTDKWTFKTAMNIKPENFGATACRGYIYVVDGPTKSVERYNPTTNTWSPVCSRSIKMTDVKCTTLDGCVIAVGSCGNVEEYDPSTNQWKASKINSVNATNIAGLFLFRKLNPVCEF